MIDLPLWLDSIRLLEPTKFEASAPSETNVKDESEQQDEATKGSNTD